VGGGHSESALKKAHIEGVQRINQIEKAREKLEPIIQSESYGTYTPWSITQPLKRIHLNHF